MAVRVIVKREKVPKRVNVNPWKLQAALLKGQRPVSRTARVKGKPRAAIRTSEMANQAMNIFKVLRRRECLNIVQQTSKFPPIAVKRFTKVTDDSIDTERASLSASFSSKLLFSNESILYKS